MTRKFHLLPVIMGLFDGGAGAGAGAAAGGAAPAAGNAGAQQGDTKGAVRGAASRGKSGESSSQPKILYGKQPQQGQQAQGERVQQQDAAAADSEEALRAEFVQLANGKYKNAYAAEMQKVIDKRFSSAKINEQTLAAQQPVIDLLMERHGISDGDMTKLYNAVVENDPTIEARAEDNGMSVEQQRKADEQQRKIAALERQLEDRMRSDRAQETARRWDEQTKEAQKTYPDLDILAEAKNPAFMRELQAGHSVQEAYEFIHRRELMQQAQNQAAASAERRVVDNIRAQGMRPRENGTSSQGSFIVKSDPRTFTREDHNNIRERVKRGEKIRF